MQCWHLCWYCYECIIAKYVFFLILFSLTLKCTNSSDIISIPIKFSSIPKPKNKNVFWTITEYSVGGDYGLENRFDDDLDDNETFMIHPGTLLFNKANLTHFSTNPLKLLNDDLYETIIEIKINRIYLN